MGSERQRLLTKVNNDMGYFVHMWAQLNPLGFSFQYRVHMSQLWALSIRENEKCITQFRQTYEFLSSSKMVMNGPHMFWKHHDLVDLLREVIEYFELNPVEATE
jgi:hypothetical protein